MSAETDSRELEFGHVPSTRHVQRVLADIKVERRQGGNSGRCGPRTSPAKPTPNIGVRLKRAHKYIAKGGPKNRHVDGGGGTGGDY